MGSIVDTDGDGLDDSLDNAPRDEKIHSFLIYETENSDSNLKAVADSLRTAKENLMINGHLQNDYKYADKTENELCDMDWINWSDFFGVSKFSYVISSKEMVTLFSMGDTALLRLYREC